MFDLAVRNTRGEMLSLTDTKKYTVTKIDGLTAAGCSINTSAVAGQDGEMFHSSRINKRNIVITVLPEDPVDENRIQLYRFFSEKENIRLFYKNRIRDVYIDGRVETLNGDLFSMKEEIQISIICPDPFFAKVGDDVRTVRYSPVIQLTEFPYAMPEEGMALSEIIMDDMELYNEGTVKTGATFHVTVQQRMNEFCIYSRQENGRIGVRYSFLPYDNVYINTGKGEKGIWLVRDGTRYNLLKNRIAESAWISVLPGINKFGIEADKFGYILDVSWRELYEGV